MITVPYKMYICVDVESVSLFHSKKSIEKDDLPKSASFQSNSILIFLSYNNWCCYCVSPKIRILLLRKG